MFIIPKKYFVEYFLEYFNNDDKEFIQNLKKLDEEDIIEMDFLDIEEEPDVEGYESFVKVRANINYEYELDSELIIYNTSSPFALMLCNLIDE